MPDQLRPTTPQRDPVVAALTHALSQADNDQEDDIFEQLSAGLDEDIHFAALRERRYEQLQQEMTRLRDLRESNHGRYIEILDEKEVIQVSARENLCVIHFFHRDFARCAIMDKHIEEIAPKYFTTRFIRANVSNVPWLVEKLSIQVLPCVACFVGGTLKHRLIGFEELGNNDAFTTAALEMRLKLMGKHLLLDLDVEIDFVAGVIEKREGQLSRSKGNRRRGPDDDYESDGEE